MFNQFYFFDIDIPVVTTARLSHLYIIWNSSCLCLQLYPPHAWIIKDIHVYVNVQTHMIIITPHAWILKYIYVNVQTHSGEIECRYENLLNLISRAPKGFARLLFSPSVYECVRACVRDL